MGNKTVLRTSFFGGYNKGQVTQFVDEIIKEKEKLKKELETKQSDALELELEKRGKDYEKLKVEYEEILKRCGDMEARMAASKTDNQPSQNIKDVLSEMEIFSEKAAIRNQMGIPEGTYIIKDEDTGADSIKYLNHSQDPNGPPTPEINYGISRTATENTVSEPLYQKIGDTILHKPTMEAERRSNMDKNQFLHRNIFDIRVAAPAPKVGTVMEQSDINNPDRQPFPFQVKASREELSILKKEIIELAEKLEQTQMEKKTLEAKLEYANELLMEIYKRA